MKSCFGCRYLFSQMDAAGGITYYCRKYPGLIVGEETHYADDPPEACTEYEKAERRGESAK